MPCVPYLVEAEINEVSPGDWRITLRVKKPGAGGPLRRVDIDRSHPDKARAERSARKLCEVFGVPAAQITVKE